MKNKYLIMIMALLTAGVYYPAYAEGESCANPIPLTRDFAPQQISGAGVKWYVANTFDLPLAIDFYPLNPNSAAPELELDFGCTPGVYDDPILCDLFCISQSAYIALPHKETPPKSYDEQGKVRYHAEFGEFYRDMLLSQGIDYNVPVYVKVTFHGGGTMTMAPDPFNNCMDGHKFMHLGDTVKVEALDGDRHVIVPYVQWQYDSIRYVWTGTTPCTIAIGNSCGFDPTDAEDGSIMDGGVIQPGGQFKVSSALLMQYVSDQVNYPNDAGMYFAKFYSEAPGVMKIEKIPAPPPAGGAIVLKYGTQTPIQRNDTNTLYAMPDSWIKAMQFYTPTDHIFKMYVGATPTFETKDAVATYQFDRTTDGHALSLFAEDMNALWLNKVSGDHYLYVRFECTDNTTILPTLWTPSDCMTKAKRIEAGEQFDVSVKSNTIFSLYYADWKGGDMTIAWTSTQATCSFFIADTCDIPNTNVPPVFYTDKAPKRNSVTIPMATVNLWEQYVDPDGYIYIRFYSQAKGKITVTTSAPEEQDPVCNPEDSIAVVTAWDSYEWRGEEYTESGVYTKDGNVDPVTGCVDTLFTLHLTIHTTSYDTYEETGCDSIWYAGKKYTESGVYTDTLYDGSGNRTIMTLNLTVKQSTGGEETQEACGSYNWHGQNYSQSGDYLFHLTNVAGCDSLAVLHLTINHPTSSEETETACDSLFWNGEWYKESGDYTYHTTNAAGCDSTATLHLTVHPSYHITLPDTVGCRGDMSGGYWFIDTLITTPGTYTRHKKTIGGCDSVLTQHVSIAQETYGTDVVTAYDSFTWIDGRTYTKSISGPVEYIANAAGCDSIVTLNLSIRHIAVIDTVHDAVCLATGEHYSWKGKSYTESGTYTTDTIHGPEVGKIYMDSLHTLVLTVNKTYAVDTVVSICADEFIWRGTTYTQNGDYPYAGKTKAGCDSVVTLHLTLKQATASELTETAYESYKWHGITYTESGDYTYETKNVAGCDSIATLHLTILPKPVVHDTITEYFCPKSGIEEHVDTQSDPHVRYLPYLYEKPREELYMDGVVSDETNAGANVNFERILNNLDAFYVAPLTQVEMINWRYMPTGGQYEPLNVGVGPQWINAGTISMDVVFRCGYRYYSAFTVGQMTESVERMPICEQPVKRIENGQVVILRGGSKYTVFGTRIE